MKRVGFIMLSSEKWLGGANYFNNLLYAISKIENRKIQPILFFSSSESERNTNAYNAYGEIIKTPLLNQSTFLGILNAILMRLFNNSFLLEGLFKENNIQIVSHSRFVTFNKSIKTINWITDFQHIYFPEMFSLPERMYRDLLFSRFVKRGNAVILGSNDSLDTYKKLYPSHIRKAKVLHLVSQPDKNIYKIKNTEDIEQKYHFSGKFFYLPNQLWKHKNHMVVLKALRLLKKERREVLVLATGYMRDYRNTKHVKEILKYVQKNDLGSNIKFLGVIDYKDVLTLMRHCVSIINPSLFEGWSSTVEEAKSIGKNMILSNIKVHKEQNPPDSIYFDPTDENELSKKLWKKWQENSGRPDYKLEEAVRKNMEQRMKEFGKKFQEIALGVSSKN